MYLCVLFGLISEPCLQVRYIGGFAFVHLLTKVCKSDTYSWVFLYTVLTKVCKSDTYLGLSLYMNLPKSVNQTRNWAYDYVYVRTYQSL